jgi:hypothetical protein
MNNSKSLGVTENMSIENIVSSIIPAPKISEAEKNRQKREEQKQQLKEQRRLKSQQNRANLSDEEREKINQKRRANISDEKRAKINQKERERRANLSEEKRALIRAKNAIQHRNKYQEEKAFLKRHLDDKKQHNNNGNSSIQSYEKMGDETTRHDGNEDEVEDEVVEGEDEDEDEDEHAAADRRVEKLLLNRQKRKENDRDYKKARYEQLKNAQEKLKEISNDENINENDIQQLQLLASRRQQTLEYGRQYAQTYRQNQHRWIPIQQVWDEDNPCR